MKQEIYCNDPIGSKVELAKRLLERGVTTAVTDWATTMGRGESG